MLVDQPGMKSTGLEGGGNGTDMGNVFDTTGAQAAQPAAQPTSGGLLPTSTQLQSFAPAQYQQFGAVPTVAPTTMTAATVDPAQNQQFYNQYAQQLQTSLQPTFDQQKQDLDASMAARGIFDSGAAVQAGNELTGQQDAALANPLGQMTQQFAGYNQQDVLQNEQNKQSTNQFNATAGNDASVFNANSYGNVVGQNMNNYNVFQNELYQGSQGLDNTLLNAELGSYDPNYQATTMLSGGLSNIGSTYGNVFNNSLQAGEQQQQAAFNNLALAAGGGGG